MQIAKTLSVFTFYSIEFNAFSFDCQDYLIFFLSWENQKQLFLTYSMNVSCGTFLHNSYLEGKQMEKNRLLHFCSPINGFFGVFV